MLNTSIYNLCLGFLPSIGPGELIVIFVVVLIIFGPKKLPEVGKALGETIKQFKKATSVDKTGDIDNSNVNHTNTES